MRGALQSCRDGRRWHGLRPPRRQRPRGAERHRRGQQSPRRGSATAGRPAVGYSQRQVAKGGTVAEAFHWSCKEVVSFDHRVGGRGGGACLPLSLLAAAGQLCSLRPRAQGPPSVPSQACSQPLWGQGGRKPAGGPGVSAGGLGTRRPAQEVPLVSVRRRLRLRVRGVSPPSPPCTARSRPDASPGLCLGHCRVSVFNADSPDETRLTPPGTNTIRTPATCRQGLRVAGRPTRCGWGCGRTPRPHAHTSRARRRLSAGAPEQPFGRRGPPGPRSGSGRRGPSPPPRTDVGPSEAHG